MRLGVLFDYFLIKFDENNVIVIVAMNVVEKWGGATLMVPVGLYVGRARN